MSTHRLLLTAAAVAIAIAGCERSSESTPDTAPDTAADTAAAPATPNTQPAPMATSPTSSALDSIDWVIEGNAMSRGAAGETFSVICVAAGEFGRDQTKQTHLREVQTERAASYNAVDGEPCPTGPILTEW